MEPLRRRAFRWRSRIVWALRDRAWAWLRISPTYLPSFQMLAALATAAAATFTAFALWAHLENLKLVRLNAVTPSCREAERLVDEIGEAISPAFPRHFCRMAIGKEEISWPRIEVLLTQAAPLVDHCESVATPQGKALRGRLLIAKALRARADSTSATSAENYQQYKEAAAKLDPDGTLVALRNLEDYVDRLEMYDEKLPPDKDPCETNVQAEWKRMISKADEAFAAPAWQREIESASLRGCLWMLRGEQAYWRAGFCSEEDAARRLQSILSFRKSMELAQGGGDSLSLAIVEVQRAQAEPGEETKQIDETLYWVNADAGRWATKAVKRAEALREHRVLLQDQQAKYMAQREELAKAVEKGRNIVGYLEELYLADLLTYMREPHAIPELLAGTVYEGDGHRSDFRYQVVIAKALCFGGDFEGSLRPFDLAAALETPELAERWGSAEVLRPLCALAASRGSVSEFPSLSDGEQAAADICTVLEVAPALVKALRQSDAGRWLDEIEQGCKDS